MKVDALFLAAHPDDAELFCGGTIAKLKSQGYTVGIIDCTEGEAATHGTVEERYKESAAASKILDIDYRINLKLVDGQLTDDRESQLLLVNEIRKTQATLLVAPWTDCRHPDHSALHLLARSCHFFSGAGKFPSDHAPHRPEKLIFHLEYHDQQPSFIIDVSEHFEKRMLAVQAYKSQFFVPGEDAKDTIVGSEQFDYKMRSRAAYYGSLIDARYGEAYISDSTLEVKDLLQL
ncbi:MAG: bacillithiol biosynthesis deacetylase BshB1 [Lentisphaeria bacterium]|nr:bacillithiol biosynthesis deacetylase BshB1 [Lentisphaeria bacterium]NQZ68918.1 bacillithiol biosynthesis deacetylase BshB1 [Lentisphaeria bacterium]